MAKDKFQIFATPHNWINIRDFLSKPKMKLVSTFDLEIKVKKDIFKNIISLSKISKGSLFTIPYMMLNNALDKQIFKILEDNKKFMKEFDYVVPSYISFYEGTLRVTFDGFKK